MTRQMCVYIAAKSVSKGGYVSPSVELGAAPVFLLGL